jgi:glycosyltransferase involved in cell wall biosynthesis
VAGSGTALHVAVDGTPFLGVRTGVGEVVAGLVGALAARDDTRVTAYGLTFRGRHELAAALPQGVAAATAPVPARLVRHAWMRVDLPRIERWTGAVDVVHATNYVAPPTRAPMVLSVYDLTFVRYPELCTADVRQYPVLVRRALARGATVHATSDFVAGEVRAEFGLPGERVVRAYPGLAPVTRGDARRGRVHATADRYVLALGTIEPRKNLPRLVRAFDALAGDDGEVRLVLAGADGWGAEELTQAVARAGHGDRVHRLGYVDAATRRDLLAGASVLAYPSLYEGFGFPPLEAMANDVPVVAGAAGAVPEVVGDAALLVDPLDVDAIAGALACALDDGTTRARLVAAGQARVTSFSWAIAASELRALYGRLRCER